MRINANVAQLFKTPFKRQQGKTYVRVCTVRANKDYNQNVNYTRVVESKLTYIKQQ
jgi:hypothetical protein